MTEYPLHFRYALVSDAFACASAGYSDTAAALTLLLSFSGETAENVTLLMSHKVGDLQSLLFAESEEVQARLGRYVSAAVPGCARLAGDPAPERRLAPHNGVGLTGVWGHRYALALFGPMAARVGMDPKKDDSHADAMLRPMLIGRAGKLGDAKIVAECKARFAKFIAGDDSAVHPDIRGAVCVVPQPLNPARAVPERSCGWIESP